MGIQGLLQFLKNGDENLSAIKPSHLSQFKGKKAAVDAYSWLHKGVYACASDLFLNKPTTKYVDYCLKNIKILQDNSITPVLVFDGCHMPFKVVNQKRKDDRQKAKRNADDLIASGRMNEAFMLMAQSINVTHEMASNLIKAARKIGVESVIAPYEADAQLVYLEKIGLVDFIISEDSDLVVFGAQKVFLKMSPTGHGEFFDADCVELCLQANKRLRGKFNPQKLLFTAILSGCDYLKNLPGIGMIKAWKFMNMTENSNIRQFLKKVPSYLKLSIIIEDDYIEGFIMAVFAFQYQLVFDTRQKKRVPLNELADDILKEDYKIFLSRFKETESDHLQLALGNIDFKNKHYDDYHPHILSYLYYGMQEEAPPKVVSPVIGFNTERAYKRRLTRESLKTSSSEQTVSAEDEDIADYYKNMSPCIPAVKAKEQSVEPPPKRIKCKFFKYKSKDFEPDQVQSRFFKKKSSFEDEHLDDADILPKNNEYDIPKENITIPENEDFFKQDAINLSDDNDSMKQVFKDAGIQIESEASNDSEEFINKQDNIETTPMKNEIIEIIVEPLLPILDTPESPIISSQIDNIKPKLREIQNVQKIAKVKKRVLAKNQSTLLGFFTKL